MLDADEHRHPLLGSIMLAREAIRVKSYQRTPGTRLELAARLTLVQITIPRTRRSGNCRRWVIANKSSGEDPGVWDAADCLQRPSEWQVEFAPLTGDSGHAGGGSACYELRSVPPAELRSQSPKSPHAVTTA